MPIWNSKVGPEVTGKQYCYVSVARRRGRSTNCSQIDCKILHCPSVCRIRILMLQNSKSFNNTPIRKARAYLAVTKLGIPCE